MNSAAYVEEAGKWAKALVHAESRFPGDYGPAMRRVASRIGISFKLLWRLHYEPPKSLGVEKYSAIWESYCDQQQRRRTEGRPEAKTALGRYLVGAADRLSCQEVGAIEHEQDHC